MKFIKKLHLIPCMLLASVCFAQIDQPTAEDTQQIVTKPVFTQAPPISTPAITQTTTVTEQPSTPVATTKSAYMIDLQLPEDWTSNLYTIVGVGYTLSKDFDGAAFNFRLGYGLGESKKHNIEFEVDFITESAASIYDRNVTGWDDCCPAAGPCGTASCGVITIPGNTVPTGNINAVNTRTKVDFNQIPVFLNYRYIGGFGTLIKGLNWYAGAGVGADFIFTRAYSTGTTYNTCCPANYPTPNGTYSTKISTSEVNVIGQGFAGLSYAFTETFNVTLGGRILGLKKYSFGGINMKANSNNIAANPPVLTPSVGTDNIHWEVELAGLWRF